MSYVQAFQALDSLLTDSRALWQVKAFEAYDLPWQADFPRLADLVWQITDDELDGLDSDSEALNARLVPVLTDDLAIQGRAWPLTLMSDCVRAGSQVSPPVDVELDESELAHFSAHIKGRKWQQIRAFASRVYSGDHEVLEWCAGKGHLGRLLAKCRASSVVSLEWQQSLCDAGQQFASHWSLPQTFVCGDALSAEAERLFKTDQHAVALHACGELHLSLLRGAVKAGTRSLAVAPCCYHLIPHSHYQALSGLGKASKLRLSKHDLQLPLQRSVIASPKARSLRLQEVAWRLGFDSLQRDARGAGHYLPIPAVKQSQLSGSFKDFCHWAAAQKQVDLPAHWDEEVYLAQGLARQRLTRRIDLVAHLFRETLELWLLLDRVNFLQEQGYEVELTRFCELNLTPRNALILANLP